MRNCNFEDYIHNMFFDSRIEIKLPDGESSQNKHGTFSAQRIIKAIWQI
jgi:hypothetical protein